MAFVFSGFRGFDGYKYSNADIARGKRAVASINRWSVECVMASEAVWWLDDQRVPNWRDLKQKMPQPPAYQDASTPWDNRRRTEKSP